MLAEIGTITAAVTAIAGAIAAGFAVWRIWFSAEERQKRRELKKSQRIKELEEQRQELYKQITKAREDRDGKLLHQLENKRMEISREIRRNLPG